MPNSLHQKLDLLAKRNNTSLNHYIIYLLSSNEAVTSCEESPTLNKDEKELLNKDERIVSQDIYSGRRGNEIGRLIGQAVSKELNIRLEPGSNKGVFNGRIVVIKSARIGNNLFGITNRMAEEIEDVILAKEVSEGNFDLYTVPFNKIKDSGRPTRSKGSSSGKVTNFTVKDAISVGVKIDSVSIQLPYPAK